VSFLGTKTTRKSVYFTVLNGYRKVYLSISGLFRTLSTQSNKNGFQENKSFEDKKYKILKHITQGAVGHRHWVISNLIMVQ
jgi:hypothetical protein